LVIEKLKGMKLPEAASRIEKGIEDTLSYMNFPREHWVKIRTNNGLERIMREIRRRTRVVGSFPDGKSALMLVGARLRHITTTSWGTKRYLNMALLQENQAESVSEVIRNLRGSPSTNVRKNLDTTHLCSAYKDLDGVDRHQC